MILSHSTAASDLASSIKSVKVHCRFAKAPRPLKHLVHKTLLRPAAKVRPLRALGDGLEPSAQLNSDNELQLSRFDPTALPSLSSGDSESYDETSSSAPEPVRIDLQLPRRSLQVTFTCNKCEGRTERLVNPIAWNKGLVIVQCMHCKVWHKLADAANLVDEIRYNEEDDLQNSDLE